jgi:hypothetical protein
MSCSIPDLYTSNATGTPNTIVTAKKCLQTLPSIPEGKAGPWLKPLLEHSFLVLTLYGNFLKQIGNFPGLLNIGFLTINLEK